MKRLLSVFLCILMLAGSVSLLASAKAVVVIAAKGMTTEIVLPENETPQERYAAETMQKYLQEITGGVLKITNKAADGVQIFIGGSDGGEPLGEGAYRIRESGGDLTICGGGKRGTIYGVFAFLEQVCGCRWYAYNFEMIPQTEKVCVDAGYAVDYTPYFEYTETDWRNGWNTTVTVANNISGGTYSHTPEERGGCVNYISGFAHTLTNQFCSAASYFESHPEYFALHGGKRTPNQLCLTNPDVLRIVTDEVMNLLRARHDPSQALQIVSLTQHDNGDYCECPSCKAIDDANGSHAGTMVTFANQVADAVKAAGYDNIAIDTFAYQYTRQTPTVVVPRENVIIRLCSIECCFGHTLDDPKCKENAKFMQDLQNWSKICDRIYVWDYGTNYGEYITFFPNIHVLQKNMQIFYENNVKGVYGEGSYELQDCDGEFSDLRYYLQAKLMQNPYMDFDAEMNGFLKAFYGDGWQALREFIDLCCDKGVTNRKHAGIFQRSKGSLPGIRAKDVKYMDALWETAKSQANTDEQLQRVLRSEFCWRYWKCSNRRGEFSIFHTPYQIMKARDDLYNDLIAAGTTRIGESTRKRALSECPALHLLRIPFCWTTLYDEPFWDFISPAVVSVYTALGKLHDMLNLK